VLLSLLLLGVSLVPDLAYAEAPLSWVLMPVRAAHPPPQDPTLLRLTGPLAKAFAGAVAGSVRVAKREERDDRCRDDGWRCPDEIASMLGVDRVVSLQLEEAHGALTAYVFSGRQGVVSKHEIRCAYEDGRLSCDAAALAAYARTIAPRALSPDAVFAAFEALQPDLRACLGGKDGATGAKVSFRVAPSGRAHGARIEPRRLQRKKVYACMARAVEGLEVAPFSGGEAGPFVFALPEAPEGPAEP